MSKIATTFTPTNEFSFALQAAYAKKIAERFMEIYGKPSPEPEPTPEEIAFEKRKVELTERFNSLTIKEIIEQYGDDDFRCDLNWLYYADGNSLDRFKGYGYNTQRRFTEHEDLRYVLTSIRTDVIRTDYDHLIRLINFNKTGEAFGIVREMYADRFKSVYTEVQQYYSNICEYIYELEQKGFNWRECEELVKIADDNYYEMFLLKKTLENANITHEIDITDLLPNEINPCFVHNEIPRVILLSKNPEKPTLQQLRDIPCTQLIGHCANPNEDCDGNFTNFTIQSWNKFN